MRGRARVEEGAERVPGSVRGGSTPRCPASGSPRPERARRELPPAAPPDRAGRGRHRRQRGRGGELPRGERGAPSSASKSPTRWPSEVITTTVSGVLPTIQVPMLVPHPTTTSGSASRAPATSRAGSRARGWWSFRARTTSSPLSTAARKWSTPSPSSSRASGGARRRSRPHPQQHPRAAFRGQSACTSRDELLSTAILRSGGRLASLSPERCVATFDGPARALVGALGAVDDLRRTDIPPARVHTGERQLAHPIRGLALTTADSAGPTGRSSRLAPSRTLSRARACPSPITASTCSRACRSPGRSTRSGADRRPPRQRACPQPTGAFQAAKAPSGFLLPAMREPGGTAPPGAVRPSRRCRARPGGEFATRSAIAWSDRFSSGPRPQSPTGGSSAQAILPMTRPGAPRARRPPNAPLTSGADRGHDILPLGSAIRALRSAKVRAPWLGTNRRQAQAAARVWAFRQVLRAAARRLRPKGDRTSSVSVRPRSAPGTGLETPRPGTGAQASVRPTAGVGVSGLRPRFAPASASARTVARPGV